LKLLNNNLLLFYFKFELFEAYSIGQELKNI